MTTRRQFFGMSAALAAAASLLPDELIARPKRTIFLPPKDGWTQSYGAHEWLFGEGRYILGGGHTKLRYHSIIVYKGAPIEWIPYQPGMVKP